MKKYEIKKIPIIGNSYSVPQRESGIFDLPAPAFKIYVWLLSHQDGFKFNMKYLTQGVKMHHITVENNFNLLLENGIIKVSLLTLEIVTSDIKVYHKSKESKSKRKSVKNDTSSL